MKIHRIALVLFGVLLVAFPATPLAAQDKAPMTFEEGRTFTPLPVSEVDSGLPAQQNLKFSDRDSGQSDAIPGDVLYPRSAGTGGGDMLETEPNDEFSYANFCPDVPFECVGIINNNTDYDFTKVPLTAGQIVEVDVFADMLYFTSPLDPFLYVCAYDGSVLAYNDDYNFPSNLNSEVIFTAPYTGDYYFVVRSATFHGGSSYDYIIAVWPVSGPIFTASNVEIEPNDIIGQADPITLPGVKIGQIGYAGDVDYSWFTAPAGATVVVDLHAYLYQTGLDAMIDVYSASGVQIFHADDMDSRDPRFNFVIPASGAYALKVSDYYGNGAPGHFYLMSVSLQDGTDSPGISKLKFTTTGLLKKVVGWNFAPGGAQVEVVGIPVNTIPSAVNPTTVLKLKPRAAVPAVGAVTVLNSDGRRSNPAMFALADQ